ncbi:MAG: outer membrane beta-barrel protein [Bacteroidetes bacterium]|nr:outer membrane beta-barrel protein [Bacteroidota bacterium]
MTIIYPQVKRVTLSIILFLLLAISTQAQDRSGFANNWMFSANIGLDAFYGDITENQNKITKNSPFSGFYWENRHPAFQFTLTKVISPLFDVSLQYAMGNLSDQKRTLNASFEGKFKELNLNGTVNFSDLLFSGNPNRKFLIYGIVGIGVTNYSAVMQYSVSDTVNTLTSKGFTGSVPIGLGLKYVISKKFNVNFEMSRHMLFTDLLDAWPEAGRSPEGYGYFSLGASYKFDMPFNVRKRNSFGAQKDNTISNYKDAHKSPSQLKRKKKKNVHNKRSTYGLKRK